MRFAYLLSFALALALLTVASRAEDDIELYQSDEDASAGGSDADTAETEEPQEATESEDDDNDSEDGEDVEKAGDGDCAPRPRTVTKTLGGKEISQETVRIKTARACIRVLQGGTPEGYTVAGNCAHCTAGADGVKCTGSGMAMSMTCEMVLGPDCQLHSVDPKDPTKACE